jgi:aminoglycoside 3-N-acetyltransferase
MVYLVHTDISKIEIAILRNSKYGAKPQNRVINYLNQYLDSKELWFPAYNYDFGKTGKFNPLKDGTTVGAINTAALNLPNSVRTFTPIYSHVGFGSVLKPKIKKIYKPFDVESEFQELLDADAQVLFLGAKFSSFTFLHYIEEVNKIAYRYKKTITGLLEFENEIHKTSVELKVRPMGKELNYDWGKIEKDLRENNVIRTLKEVATKNIVLSMAESLDLVTALIRKDPYYLLDSQTKEWVMRLMNEKNHPFQLEDFEGLEI